MLDTVMLASDLLPTPGTAGSGPVSIIPEEGMKVLEDLTGRTLCLYECQSLLGAGGMGRVYRATHAGLGRQCALKILSPKTTHGDIDYVLRFQHEGKAAAGLIHPNIVTIHAIGETDGFHFLEMEFVAGETLQALVSREGKLTPTRATKIAVSMSQGLAEAHRTGVIHRDLKAENVLLNHHGLAKIVDFGLAKRVLDDDGVPAGRIVGTPHYMAPELFHGTANTTRSDVYALGVCYFVMLTGKLPYPGGTFEDMRRTVGTTPLPNIRKLAPGITLEMAECLMMLMDNTPANRPESAMQAVHLLKAVLGQMQALESLLQEAFGDDENVTWTRQGERYDIELTLPQGRRQRVFLEATGKTTSEKLLMIYSTCCKGRPDYYEHALRLNSEIPHGGISLREIDGTEYFVIIDTYPRGTISADAVRRSVWEVGRRADVIEDQLTDGDVH